MQADLKKPPFPICVFYKVYKRPLPKGTAHSPSEIGNLDDPYYSSSSQRADLQLCVTSLFSNSAQHCEDLHCALTLLVISLHARGHRLRAEKQSSAHVPVEHHQWIQKTPRCKYHSAGEVRQLNKSKKDMALRRTGQKQTINDFKDISPHGFRP